MTLTKLIIVFAVVAVILTALLKKYISNGSKKTWLFFLQNFVGVWFVFSGVVKAIDPMGTAFKMEQYFAAFEQTFKPTWLGFISSVFPLMAKYAVGISISMIILEILLGVALIIGFAPKWTTRIFFLLLVFFTVLTGFTYLTGYVPSNKNFFDFSAWGEFDKNQMRVSDCGCFGDFLKLEPKISFFKDLGLLIPGVIFLLFHRSFSQLWLTGTRKVFMILSLLSSLLFSWYNTFMNEPIVDFRAFHNNADIATIRKTELEAAQNVQIENAALKNRKSGETIKVPYATYLKEFKKYPKEDWEIKMEYGESAIPRTKVSDYLIMDLENKDVTLDLLNHDGYSLMMSAYKVHGEMQTKKLTSTDSIFRDSVSISNKDTIRLRVLDKVEQIQSDQEVFIPSFGEGVIIKDKINPIINEFVAKGIKVYGVTGGLGPLQIDGLSRYTDARYPIYQADDVLLKTIMRSDPGLILWKNGKIVQKWHYKHLPTQGELETLMK